MEKYKYSNGYFVNTGNQKWEEWQNGTFSFTFRETDRDNDWITLNDSSRNIWVALPVKGGMCYYAYGGDSQWTELYEVVKEPGGTTGSGIKLLHLSDLHIHADTTKNTAIQQRLDYIKKNYDNHYLIISGDIIDNEGDPAAISGSLISPMSILDITPHLKIAEKALTNAYNMLKPFLGRVFICPGNHDYGILGNIYFNELRTAFDNILWKPLNNAAAAIPLGAVTDSKRPYLYALPNLRLLSINTAADPFTAGSGAGLATGTVGGSQLRALSNFFLPGTVIPGIGNMLGYMTFVFFHHHPWLHMENPTLKEQAMILNDSDKLMKELRGNADLILFGHRHQAKRYTAANVPGGQITYGALAAGSGRHETTAYEIAVTSSSSAPGIKKVKII